MAAQVDLLFSAPTPAEAAALDLAARYLTRAGNEAASRLIRAGGLPQERFELLSTIRDEMRDSAALCECLLSLFDGWEFLLES